MVDLGQNYTFDPTQVIAGMKEIGKTDELIRDGLRQSGQVAQTALAQAALAAEQYTNKLDAILTESQGSAKATRQFAGEVAGLVKEIRDTAAAQEAARKAAAASADERRKATAAAKEAAKAEKQAAKEAEAAAKAAAAAAKDAQGFFSKLVDNLTGKLSGTNPFGSILSSVTAATGGFFALSAISDKVKEGLGDYAALTGAQATLKAISGSAAAGAQEFVYVRAKADELGLALIPTAKAYAGLFAAAKEANIPVAQTRAIFEGVTSAAKVLNLAADDTNGVLLALQQIVSKGTVASEELRGQIGERLPGAFGLAAKAMGLTTTELGKQLQAGKVLASDFLPKFAAQLKATYGAATADAAQQVGSNLGRINTYFAESSARIGAAFAPAVAFFADLVSASKTTAQQAQSSADAYFKQRDAVKSLVPAVGGLLSNYESLNAISGRSIGQQIELDKTIQALAKSVPGAVTEFDKYGKALGISGDAVRDFIKDQQNLTAYLNRTALKENSADLRNLLKQQEDYQKQLALLNQTEKETGRRVLPKGGTAGGQILYYTPEETAKIVATAGEQLAQIQRDIDANLENRQRLRGKSPLLPTGDDAANDKAIEGLIEKQEKLIKDLKDRQKKAVNENKNDGTDFLFGKGGLNEALKAAEKELDRLQGKIDKSAAARTSKLDAALKALAAEREALTTKAIAANVKEADDARERSRLQYEQDVRNIGLIRQKLIEREKAVAKAGGKGVNADGKIDGVQQQQLAALEQKAVDDRLDRDYKASQELFRRNFVLREDSDQHERDALLLKYQDEQKLDADNEESKFLRRQKYLRDAAALEFQINKRNSERAAEAARSSASFIGNTYGAGAGVSVFQAKLKEKQLLLDIERQSAQDIIDNAVNLDNKQAALARAAGIASLAQVQKQQEALDRETKRADFSIYKLIFGENDSQQLRDALNETAASVASSLSQILQSEQQAAANRAGAATQAINELSTQIQAQIALREEGSASNIKGLLAQQEQEKQVRKDALADQRQAAQEQVLIDALSQASSITTAAANVFEAFSAIPYVGVALGIAAAGVLIGGFTAAKIKAYQAAGKVGGSYFAGGYTGDGDPRQESTAQGPRPYTYHKGEYIMPHDVTADLRHALLEPIHKGEPGRIDWGHPKVQALLPDYELPGRLQAAQTAAHLHLHANMEPLRQEVRGLHDELVAIKTSNREMADKPDRVPLADGSLYEVAKDGSTKRKEFKQ